MNQLVFESKLHQPVDLKLHQLFRQTNGSTGSGAVSWCTIASPGACVYIEEEPQIGSEQEPQYRKRTRASVQEVIKSRGVRRV